MLYTLRGYKGTDPKNGGPSYIATFTDDKGKIDWCTAYVANDQTAGMFTSPQVFMLLLQFGQILGGRPSEWVDKFLEQPDIEQLWESEEDGEFATQEDE